MSEYFLQMSHGVEGPYSLAQIVALNDDGLLDADTTVSQDQQSWGPISEFLDSFTSEQLAGLDTSLFVNCPRCDDGVIEKLRFGQKLMTIVVSLILIALASFAGYALTKVVELKLMEIDSQAPIKSQWPKILLISLGVVTNAWYFAQRAFSLNKKWMAWIQKICPWCEDGFIRRGQASLFQSAVYFIDAFFFKEVLFPIYKTLTYQWLWRGSEKGTLDEDDEDESTGPGLLKTTARFIGFTFVILGAIPFLWAFSAENSTLGLGLSAAVVFIMFRLIFAKNAKNSAYRKGIVFLMLPIYFVSMVELIRWCLLLTLNSGAVPPDISDLYKQGLDILLKSSIFMGVPKMIGLKLSTLKLASTWKSLSFTGITVFFTKLVLNAALIVALVKSFTQALYSTRIYRRTGERGVTQSSSAGALAEVEELTLQGSPSHIEKVTEGLQSVAATLAKSKAYVKSVATAAEPDSDQQKAALKALNFIENEKLDTFIAPEEGEEETDGSASEADTGAGLIERLISMVIVGAWLMLFGIFFQHAIDTAVKREIADLLGRAAQESLVQQPLKRRKLYARVLDKDKNNHDALRLGAATDLDIADQRVNLLDMDEALIEIDTGFKKTIYLQKLIGISSELYKEELRLLNARAYALRGRIFFYKKDPNRARTELLKERTQETRRLLFALAMDQAAKNLEKLARKDRPFEAAKNFLGFDVEYAPASLVTYANSLLILRDGEIAAGAKELGVFLLKVDSFSKDLRQNARYLRVRALLQLNQLEEAEKECLLMIKNDPEFGPIYLEYGDLLRRRGNTKGALAAYDKAAKSSNPTVRDHGLLAGVVLALKLKKPDVAVERFLKVAKQRVTDPLFQSEVELYLRGKLDAATLVERAARWGGERHKAQMALARLVTGIRALTENRLGVSALEFRRVFAQVREDSAEASVASALLDEIQIRREGRSFQSERFYHRFRLAKSAKLIRAEIRSVLFSPDRIIKSFDMAMKMDSKGERARAVEKVAAGKLVPNRLLFGKLVEALEDDHADTRLASLNALADNPFAVEAIEKIIKTLKDRDERVRRAAIRVMKGFSAKSAVSALKVALSDDDEYVRRDAAYALAKFGSFAMPAKDELIKRLNDDKVMVRDAAFAGVKALGDVGVDSLIAAIGTTKDSYISIQAVDYIQAKHPKLFDANLKKITTFLIKVLTTDEDLNSRDWAAQTIGQVRYDKRVADKKILNLVETTLRNGLSKVTDPKVGLVFGSAILSASRSYGIDGTQAVKYFVDQLKNRPVLHDRIFEFLLVDGIDEEAVPILYEMVKEPTLHKKAQDFLNNLLNNSKRKKEIAEEAIKQLKKHLEGDNEDLVERTENALAGVRTAVPAEITAPLFVKLLTDPSKNVRDRISNVALDFEFEDGVPESIRKQLRAGTFSKNEGVQYTHFGLLRDEPFEDESMIPNLRKMLASKKLAAADDEEKNSVEIGCLAGVINAATRLPTLREEVVGRAVELANSKAEDVYKAALQLILTSKGPNESLALLSKSNVEIRIRLLGTMEEWVGTEAGEGKQGEVFTCLFNALSHKEDQIIEVALQTLAKIELEDDQKSKVFLAAKKMREKKGSLAGIATRTMLSISPLKMPESLVTQTLKGEDSDLAFKVLEILSGLEDLEDRKKSASLMISCFANEDESVSENAMELLADMGEIAHPALQVVLTSGKAAFRIQALNALAAQRSAAKKLAPVVAKLIKSNRPKLARAAVRTLGLLGTTQFNSQIRSLVDIASPRLKGECWIALSRLGEKDGAAEIERMLTNGVNGADSEYLAKNLLQIDRSRGLRFLMGSLRTRYGQIPATQAAAMLGSLGKEAKVVLPDLIALTDDPNPAIQKAANAAIAKIG